MSKAKKTLEALTARQLMAALKLADIEIKERAALYILSGERMLTVDKLAALAAVYPELKSWDTVKHFADKVRARRAMGGA